MKKQQGKKQAVILISEGCNWCFESAQQASNFLKVDRSTVLKRIETGKAIKGYYCDFMLMK